MAAVPQPTNLEALEHREQIIKQAQDDAYDALREIQELQLYKARGYDAFEHYTKEVWGFAKSRAYQLVDFSKIRGYLRDEGYDHLPESEAQVRPLTRLRRGCKDEDEYLSRAGQAWRQTVDQHTRSDDVPEVTGKDVESTLTHFGINGAGRSSQQTRLETFKRQLNTAGGSPFVKHMSGDEFVRKHGAKALGSNFPQFVEWIVDAHQEALAQE